MQELAFYGGISDDDDVQDVLISEAGAVGRWNPDIMSGKAPQVCINMGLRPSGQALGVVFSEALCQALTAL